MNKQYIKNIGIVSIGPLFASILGFFAEPWISRAWGPMVYGIGAYYHSVITIVSGLLFLRYNFAIVQAKNRREAHNLLALCFIVLILMLLIIAPFYKFASSMAKGDFPFDKYEGLIFLSAAFASIGILYRFWYSGQKKFIAISGSLILSSLSNTILLLVYGAMGKVSEQNMIYIRVFTTMLVPIVLIAPYFRRDFWITLKVVSLKGILSVAKKFKRFPLYEYWGFAANVMAYNIPVIIIARYWGQESTGLYAKAFNLLNVMVLLVGNSVNRVLHKEAADLVNQKKSIASLLIQTSNGLIKYSILPTVFLILLAPEFFSILLGQRWQMSGVFSQYLSLWTLAAILGNATLPIFGVLNKQLHYTLFTVSSLVARVIILVIMGTLKADIVLSTAVFSIANFLVVSLMTGYILHVGGVKLILMYKALGKLILQLLPYIALILTCKYILILSSFQSLAIGIVLAIPYAYLFYIRNSAFAGMGRKFFKSKQSS